MAWGRRITQARVRNRASIMARHMFCDEGDGFAHEQVAQLLHSLNIASHEEQSWAGPGGFHPTPTALEDTAAQWAHAFQRESSAAAPRQQPQQQHEGGGWAEEFGSTQGGGDWAAQFHGLGPQLPPHLVRAHGAIQLLNAGHLWEGCCLHFTVILAMLILPPDSGRN